MNSIIACVDASPEIGFGHLKRTIQIMKDLQMNYNIQPTFITYNYLKSIELIQNEKFNFITFDNHESVSKMEYILDNVYDSLIFIDSLFYFSKEKLVEIKKRNNNKIIFLHNYTESIFYSNTTIFPIAHLSSELIEDPRWNNECKLYYGREFVIINENVKNFKKTKSINDVPTLSITTGASDPYGIMIKTLKLLSKINFKNLKLNIVALPGFDFIHQDELNELDLDDNFLIKPFNYNDLFNSDYVITSFGITAYELIYHNIPIFTIGLNEDNTNSSEILSSRHKVSINLGYHGHLSKELFEKLLIQTLKTDKILNDIKEKQYNFIDGDGTKRISEIIFNEMTSSN
jgi:spore coat polysaccharide biosynthesis predicted glycosyltransferase SpsG